MKEMVHTISKAINREPQGCNQQIRKYIKAAT